MTEISSMLITHVKASIEEMERSWHGDLEKVLKKLYSHELVYECAILKTCNRVEIYVVSPKGSKMLIDFAKEMGVPDKIVDFYDHEDSLRHLLRVASGLESMIVGEDQILGQIKELFNIAKKSGTIGKTLETAFNKAIQVGKRVRNETRINKGSVSIGSAAVELVEDILKDLNNKTILVIGAGTMGSLVARALAHKNVNKIFVANRTFERAVRLAVELCGQAVPYELMNNYLKISDVVISATSAPHYVLTKKMVESAMEERDKKLLLVDIADPRDIEPKCAEIPNVELHNIDSLKIISDRNLQRRIEEAKKAEIIVEEELKLLKAQYKRQKADKILKDLYSLIESIKKREQQKAINKLSAYHTLGEIEQEVISDLCHSIAYKILAEPTKVLRNAAEHSDEDFLNTTIKLFGLDGSKLR
ncbi:MAG: glutamyl-tRNA reductase [Methanosarcinales archaeon]